MLKKSLRMALMMVVAAGCCAGVCAPAFAAVPDKPSEVRVKGTQLMLANRMPNGSLDKSAPFIIKGVNWSPATRAPVKGVDPAQPNRIIDYGYFFDIPYGRSKGYEVWDYWLKKEYRTHYKADIRLMKDMNASTVRLRNFCADRKTCMKILDAFYENGIKVIMVIDVTRKEIGNMKRLRKIVEMSKDHPAILMWSMEPAWNIQANQFYEYGSPADTMKAVNNAAKVIKSVDTAHPVDVCIAEMLFGDEKTSPGQEFVANCDAIDVFGLTVYTENGMNNVLKQWKKLTPKPLYVSRVGTDSFKTESYDVINGYQAIKIKGKEDQKMQADHVMKLWEIVRKNLSALDPDKVCLGALATEFNDALWPVGCYHFQMGGIFDYADLGKESRYAEYDAEGMYFKGGAPDDVVNVEYLGIVNADRKPKEAYTALQRLYKELDEPTEAPDEGSPEKK